MLVAFSNANDAGVQDVLAAAAAGSMPRGAVEMTTPEGLGAGMNLFATIAMWMFGIRISSLVLLFLVFVGTTAPSIARTRS